MPEPASRVSVQEASSLLQPPAELTEPLQCELEEVRQLFAAQPLMVQRFIESQAASLADAIIANVPEARFMLPDRVLVPAPADGFQTVSIPPEQREYRIGGWATRLRRIELRVLAKQRLTELEQSENQGIREASRLLRHTTAVHIVYNLLPAGRSVHYLAEEGETIPSIPVEEEQVESALTAPTDAIAEERSEETERGELLVPFVPYARRFFLPQWVAFDENGELLLSSVQEAESHIASMQRYLRLLHYAAAFSPCIIVDEVYQQKRYGMLGQLVNQGRALAIYQTRQIIETIKRRARAQNLNRGLTIRLPYFDDQDLTMKIYPFVVIPAGRIMFVPAFVVRAVREEEAKVAQDTRLNPTTRKYIIKQLKMLEEAFLNFSLRSP
ncbi:MAG: hypothetical protein RML93_05635 [Anaerolineales bacterium]|nr:hypothetical protein [Anaerolineales bacterium]MCS7247936.1 hypothetical protein [Anaerolineales bacterium]MDW8161746.1 hypothetical protein [Anaerolineales bacterium]MDW8446757.1 hypothetical protein [Anaerolineales bacterium]